MIDPHANELLYLRRRITDLALANDRWRQSWQEWRQRAKDLEQQVSDLKAENFALRRMLGEKQQEPTQRLQLEEQN